MDIERIFKMYLKGKSFQTIFKTLERYHYSKDNRQQNLYGRL